jgi:hypothetical protein
MEHVVLAAWLRKDAYQRALALGATDHVDPGGSRLERFSIFLSHAEVAVLFEAREPEHLVRRLLNDPVRSAGLSPWIPLFEGPLHRANEAYRWSRGEPTRPSGAGPRPIRRLQSIQRCDVNRVTAVRGCFDGWSGRRSTASRLVHIYC